MMATIAAILAVVLILVAVVVMAPTFRRPPPWLWDGEVTWIYAAPEWAPITTGFSHYEPPDPEEEARRRRLQMYAEIGLEVRAKEAKPFTIIGPW